MKRNISKRNTIIKGIIFTLLVPLSLTLMGTEENAAKPEAISSAGAASFNLTASTLKHQLDLSAAKKQEFLTASRYFNTQNKSKKIEAAFFTTSMVTLAALNVADYLTTMNALKHEGLVEGNPIMKPFVKREWAFAAIKIGLTTGNYLLLKNIHKKNKTLAWILSSAGNFIMSYIVARNLKMIDSLR